MQHHGSLKTRYETLKAGRESYLRRARQVTKLTLPWLIPRVDDQSTPDEDLPTPAQSVGARGCQNLASSLILALMPPSAPWFRLHVNKLSLIQAGLDTEDEVLEEIQKKAAEVERAVHEEIEARSLRPEVHEAMLHLVVAGNVVLRHYDDAPFVKVYGLSHYVAQRDGRGNLTLVIVKESVAPETLSDELRAKATDAAEESQAGERSVDLYTCARLVSKGTWMVWQEFANGAQVQAPETVGDDEMPFQVLRMNRVSGEDYGRGFGEQYLGDLLSLESLCKSLVELAEAASRVVPLINPNSTTSLSQLQRAIENPGTPCKGSPEDIKFLQMEKFPDFQVAKSEKDDIQRRLGLAFLLNTSIQREGERVTAEEIRFMAMELEKTLSGAYSALTEEFQLPFIRRLLKGIKGLPQIIRKGKLIQPVVVTGVEALGRGADYQRMKMFLKDGIETIGPEFMTVIKIPVLSSRLADAAGINQEGLFKTSEELAEEAQQQAQQSLVESSAPGVIQEVAKGAVNQSVA